MTFDDLPAGSTVYLDANTFIYHFSAHPAYGPACTGLLERIERKEHQGIASSHTLADVAHRLMTIEAMNRFAWPAAGILLACGNSVRKSQNLASISKGYLRLATWAFGSCRSLNPWSWLRPSFANCTSCLQEMP